MQARRQGGRDFQEAHLGRLRDEGEVTTLYLQNRSSLRGWIRWLDPYVLLFQPLDGSPAQMVYKSAVVSASGSRARRKPGGQRHGPRRPGPGGGAGEHRRAGPGAPPFQPPRSGDADH